MKTTNVLDFIKEIMYLLFQSRIMEFIKLALTLSGYLNSSKHAILQVQFDIIFSIHEINRSSTSVCTL